MSGVDEKSALDFFFSLLFGVVDNSLYFCRLDNSVYNI